MFSSSMATDTVLTCPIYHSGDSYCMLYESSITYSHDDDNVNDNNNSNNSNNKFCSIRQCIPLVI